MQQTALYNNIERYTGKKKKFGFYKCVYTYALGGVVGTLYETLLNLVKGNGFMYCNGCILTPFNFVYGTGALVIVLFLRNKKGFFRVFFIGAAAGGIVEYVLSFLEETILGTRSWNYTGRLLNINGRTTIPYMIGWGILCAVVVLLIYNPFNTALDNMPQAVAKNVAIILAVIIAVDLIITVAALVRYACRNSDMRAFTFVGEFIDRIFTDEYMHLHFPKMNFT